MLPRVAPLSATIGACLLSVACGGPDLPVTPPPPAPPPFHIEPAAPILVPGSSVQLRAIVDGSTAEVAVAWRLGDPLFGTLTSGGLLTVPLCLGTSSASVRALLLADTAHTATTLASRLSGGAPDLLVQTLSYVSVGAPARIDSVAGDIDVSLQLRSCITIGNWQVHLRQGNTITTVATAMFAPPAVPAQPQILRWNANTTPNGDYLLFATAAGGPVQLTSLPIPISVRHP